MEEIHVFQHYITGLQILVYKTTKEQAMKQFKDSVSNYNDWVYLGVK